MGKNEARPRTIAILIVSSDLPRPGLTVIRRLYAYFWLVCLFFPILYLTQTPLTTAPLLIALTGLVIFVAAYFWVMWQYPLSGKGRARSWLRSSWLFPIGITLLVLFLSLTFGSAFAWLFLGVSAIIGVMFPARQALREVREAIAGYRQRTLASELDGVQQILEAAGISYMIEHTAEGLTPGVDMALAWAVREGVTNVIRHSRAKQCLIRVASEGGIVRAEVINDGFRGPERLVDKRGTGLAGLAERIAAQGGSIDAGPFSIEKRPGFRLMVEIPIQDNLDRKEGWQT